MMEFIFERQNHQKPDMKKLNEMRRGLEELIYEDLDCVSFDWQEVVTAIIEFQFEDGSFNLLDSYRIESDCRVYYCHEATYICTALLMKALLLDENILKGREKEILQPALHMCCARKLSGHGFSGRKGQITALNYFMRGDVKRFLQKYSDMCPEFTWMMQNIEQYYAVLVETASFTGAWGEDYEADIRRVHEYFAGNYIFVYGTLMQGRENHDYFLGNAPMIGRGEIDGFTMLDLGYYPGVVRGKGRVCGEVYRVTEQELRNIDILEAEGVLYRREPVLVKMEEGLMSNVFVYIYNRAGL